MRGWDTGTLEINHASFTVSEDAKSEFELKPMRLRAVTSDKMHIWPKKDGEVKGDTLVWDMEEKVRLPIYRRYQGSLTIGLGRASGPLQALHIKDQPDAVAVLWLQDLTDDIEQEVKLPVLSGEEDDLTTLRQNAINDQTAKHHKFKVIGFLTIRLKLDSGLDEDHEVRFAMQQTRRQRGIANKEETTFEPIAPPRARGIVSLAPQQILSGGSRADLVQRPYRGRGRDCAQAAGLRRRWCYRQRRAEGDRRSPSPTAYLARTWSGTVQAVQDGQVDEEGEPFPCFSDDDFFLTRPRVFETGSQLARTRPESVSTTHGRGASIVTKG